MKIQKAVLKAFGKFDDAEFDFADGLNVVYGGNEAGKSTLHKFLGGTFFGFFKPYSKNKLYTSDYEKYYPWNSSTYAGSLQYEADGKTYILERGFDKNNEYVKLYDAVTGEDLTSILDYDSVTKLPCANRHLGVNGIMFDNTVSIAQMGNATDDALATEIGELLVNTTQTLSSDVSYMGAVEALKEKKNKIGTPRQSKSPYGLSVAKLEALNTEYAQARAVYDRSKRKYLELKRTEESLEGAKKDKKKLMRLQYLEQLKGYLDKYEKYLPLKQRLSELKKELEHQISVSEEDYEKYTRLAAASEETQTSLKQLNIKIDDKQKELSIMQEQVKKAREALGETKTGDMTKDKILLENTLEKLVSLKKQRESEKINEFADEYDSVKKKTKLFSMIMIVSAILTLISGVAGYLVNDIFYYIGGGLLAIAIAFGIMWFTSSKKQKQLEPTYDKFDTMMSRTVSMELMCRTEIAHLKDKYGCDTVAELREILDSAEGYTAHLKQFTDAEGKLKVICDELTEEREKQTKRLDAMNAEMKRMLTNANVLSAEQLRDEININRDKNVAFAKLEATQNAIKELLGDMSEEQLKQKASEAENTDLTALNEITDIDERLEETNDQITDMSAQIANIRGSVAQSESEVRALSDIEEDIQRTEHDVTEYEKYSKAYELAIATVQSVSKDIHSNFATQFNEHISEIVSNVTGGKYDDVKTDDKMLIRASDKQSGRIVGVDKLSSGTIDQVYFAVRIAVADMIIQNKSLPVILDDCFVQYDNERLENMLVLLNRLSAQRQIILFTCRTNEKESLDKLNIPYNFIEI